jgi:hypothetical protein
MPDKETLEMLSTTYHRMVNATEQHDSRCKCGLCRNKSMIRERLFEVQDYVQRRTINGGQGGG